MESGNVSFGRVSGYPAQPNLGHTPIQPVKQTAQINQ